MHVALVEPEIHGNTGNAGRTCLATGAQLHLIEPLGFEISDARVRRAGLDYWERVAPQVWPDWSTFESRIPGLGEPWFFSAEAEREIWDAEFAPDTVLVFGKESVGLAPAIREAHRDRLLRFPILDSGVRSLNLANCVALGCYEVLRQLRSH
ncbi:MAG: tRNA (uridine(34)/cytosine(34)/5-carboxymethylaminomethyluridine(34)-2'-O)-methyltransferase TrmL [Acidobacteria bacterium]|nr:tRNA (uridine(34)/cytosine(34)/5-carboxymethylaminomethyluridine(34)-2'-O)-methyltransferase TrmL [Acidobacteriota bacterium]